MHEYKNWRHLEAYFYSRFFHSKISKTFIVLIESPYLICYKHIIIKFNSILIPDSANSQCSDIVETFSVATTMTTKHDWGPIFKKGVSYRPTSSISVAGFKVYRKFDLENASNGTLEEEKEDIISIEICTAPPMTEVNCRIMVYKTTIEQRYTIYWKNSASTRGIYKFEGWQSTLEKTAGPYLPTSYGIIPEENMNLFPNPLQILN